jgi:hypothetical protein
MHADVAIGLLLAVACAAAASVSGLLKQRGAAASRPVDIRRPLASAAALFRSRLFMIGWIVAVFAWVLHAGAIALAPLALAQAVIAGGLALLGLVAERFFGFELERRQWAGLIVVAFGMAVLGATAHSERNHTSYGVSAILAFETVAIVFGSACAVGCRASGLKARHGLLLGVAAGCLFGVADVSIKAVTSGSHGTLGIVGPWTVLGILAGIGAFYASARSLQTGEAISVITASAVAANLVGILGGVIVFREGLGSDPPTIIGRVVAFTLIIVAAALIPGPVRAEEAAADPVRKSDREAVPPTSRAVPDLAGTR